MGLWGEGRGSGGQCYYYFHNGHVVILPSRYYVCAHRLVEFST